MHLAIHTSAPSCQAFRLGQAQAERAQDLPQLGPTRDVVFPALADTQHVYDVLEGEMGEDHLDEFGGEDGEGIDRLGRGEFAREVVV